MNLLNLLWGGVVESVAVDVVAHRLELIVRVLASGQPALHRLTFSGVTDVRFFDESGESWDYAELTAIHAERNTDGGVTTEITLWSEASGLAVRSRRVAVDDHDVVDGIDANA